MPPDTDDTPRDETLRVRLPAALLRRIEAAAARVHATTPEYVRSILASHSGPDAWTSAPPYNGPYWVAGLGTIGPLLAIVSNHDGRSYDVRFPINPGLDTRMTRRRAGLLAGARWSGPLRWPTNSPV